MALESENRKLDKAGAPNPSSTSSNRNERGSSEYEKVPESGWQAGQGISNAQVITQSSGEDQNGTERGPSDAGIGMEEIRKRKEGSWASGSSLE